MAANNEIAVKFKELSLKVSSGNINAAPSAQGMSAADVLSTFLDVDGCLHTDLPIVVDGQKFTLGDLFRRLLSLEGRVDAVEDAVDAQGGVRVGSHYFASHAELLALVLKENPKGKGLAAFVDPMTMFSHTTSLLPKSKREHQLLNPNLTIQDIISIEQSCHSYACCSPYTGTTGDPYNPGQPIEAFKSEAIFYGEGAAAGKGKKEKILTEVALAGTKIDAYATFNLSNAPVLKSLANELVNRSMSFHKGFMNHCDSERKVLESLSLPVDDILLLFSEFAQLIFEYWHAERVSINDTSEQVNPAERLATYLWVTLKIHALVEEFAQGGFAHHPRIQSAFVRFLTRKTGENSAAGVGSKLTKLEKEAKSAYEKAVEAKRDALAAKNQAKGVSDSIDSLVKKNELKK